MDNNSLKEEEQGPNRGSMPLPDETINRGDSSGDTKKSKEEIAREVTPPKNTDDGTKKKIHDESGKRDVEK